MVGALDIPGRSWDNFSISGRRSGQCSPPCGMRCDFWHTADWYFLNEAWSTEPIIMFPGGYRSTLFLTLRRGVGGKVIN